MNLLAKSSRLLIDDQPLQVLPDLAVKIGLNEAIIIQQIHYWLKKESAKSIKGSKWIYNSYPQWQEQFPFWSIDTIKRSIHGLEKIGVLRSGNFNKVKMDKTKWYTINYDALNRLDARWGQNAPIVGAKRTIRGGNLHSPIPEITTEIENILKESERPVRLETLNKVREDLMAKEII